MMGLAMRGGSVESGVQSTGRHSCRPDVSLRLGVGRCNWSGGRNDGGAARLSLDPDMMSGIQEINDRTNDSSLITFQAPLHQVFKGNPVKA
jgi:hypothetical protein